MIYGHRRRYLYLGDPGYMTASPQAIDTALDRIDRAKITDVMLIVWNGQGAVWYQPTASVADTASDQTWDALAYWVSRAHRRGIRCHAWFAVAYRNATFNAYPAFSPAGTPASKYNLWLQPVRDWLTATRRLKTRRAWSRISRATAMRRRRRAPSRFAIALRPAQATSCGRSTCSRWPIAPRLRCRWKWPSRLGCTPISQRRRMSSA